MKIEEMSLTETKNLSSAGPDLPASEAAELLTEHNIGALPVIDDLGELVGIISERDVVRAIAKSGGSLNGHKVSDLMSTEVITCQNSSEIEEIMEVMHSNSIRHIPVVDGKRLISIVSSRDVMTAILEETKHNFHTMALAYETTR